MKEDLRRAKESTKFEEEIITYSLLNEFNAGLQVEAEEVNEAPFDALTLVLLLLQDEHGVVEQLLKLLVGVVMQSCSKSSATERERI